MSTVRPLRRTAALCLGLFALCFQSNLLAENGRNFAASYQLQNVHSDGSTVTFQLSLKLFNYSGFDLVDAKIALASRYLPPDAAPLDFRGAFEPVSLKYRKFINLRGAFAVPELEYRQWKKGVMPNLIVTYTNESGDPVQNNVELSKTR